MEMTYHCKVERAERIQKIIALIGLGQVVREKYYRQSNLAGHGKYVCITDTGITIVKSEDKQKVITMYVTTYRELVAIYGGEKKIPPYLRKKVDRNQTKYIHNGKTIW